MPFLRRPLGPCSGATRGVRALGVVCGCGTEQREGEGNVNSKCLEVTLPDVGISPCSLSLFPSFIKPAPAGAGHRVLSCLSEELRCSNELKAVLPSFVSFQ